MSKRLLAMRMSTEVKLKPMAKRRPTNGWRYVTHRRRNGISVIER